MLCLFSKGLVFLNDVSNERVAFFTAIKSFLIYYIELTDKIAIVILA